MSTRCRSDKPFDRFDREGTPGCVEEGYILPPVSPRLLDSPLEYDSVGPLGDGSTPVPLDGSDAEYCVEGSYFTPEQFNLRTIMNPKCAPEQQKDFVDGCPLPYQTQMIILDHLSKLPMKKAEKMLFSDSMFNCIRHVLTHPKEERIKTPAFREWCHANFYAEGLGGYALICNKGDKRPLATREQVHSLLCHAHMEADHGGRDRTSQERYYYPLPKEIVSEFVKSCPTCQRKKTANCALTLEQLTEQYKDARKPHEVAAVLERGEPVSLIEAKLYCYSTGFRPMEGFAANMRKDMHGQDPDADSDDDDSLSEAEDEIAEPARPIKPFPKRFKCRTLRGDNSISSASGADAPRGALELQRQGYPTPTILPPFQYTPQPASSHPQCTAQPGASGSPSFPYPQQPSYAPMQVHATPSRSGPARVQPFTPVHTYERLPSGFTPTQPSLRNITTPMDDPSPRRAARTTLLVPINEPLSAITSTPSPGPIVLPISASASRLDYNPYTFPHCTPEQAAFRAMAMDRTLSAPAYLEHREEASSYPGYDPDTGAAIASMYEPNCLGYDHQWELDTMARTAAGDLIVPNLHQSTREEKEYFDPFLGHVEGDTIANSDEFIERGTLSPAMDLNAFDETEEESGMDVDYMESDVHMESDGSS